MSDQQLIDELVTMTCDLVKMPSVAEQPEQLRAVIDYAEQYVRAIPDLYIHRGEYAGKPYLIATLHDTRSPKLMLNGHLDVVPGRLEQFAPQVREGRIYGRGTQDMKGSCAVYLRLLRDLAARPERPDVGWMFVSDEEIGGEDGTGELARQGWNCQFLLVGEPTDLQICYAHKGVAWMEIHLAGDPAHGSRPWDGRNALAALREGMVAMERRYPTPDEAAWMTTVVPTLIRGGEASNRLPERVSLTLDVRHVPQETPETIVANLRECFPDGEVRLIRHGVPLDTDPNHPLVQRLSHHLADVTGQKTGFYHEHFATDARFYSAMGIPAVCCGPIGAGLHSNNEWVDIASLGTLYEVVRRFALDVAV